MGVSFPRHITTAEREALFARNLPDREHRRAVLELEIGTDALRRLDRESHLYFTAKMYRDALNAAKLRLRDGSIQRYQLQGLAQAFWHWRAAAERVDRQQPALSIAAE